MVSYVFKRPYGSAECSGCSYRRSAPPRTLAPLAPPHTAAPPASASNGDLFLGWCFVESFPPDRSYDPRTAPRPASTIMFVPHIMAPAPRAACGRLASSAVLVVPGASALLSSFVQLGHSCGIA